MDIYFEPIPYSSVKKDIVNKINDLGALSIYIYLLCCYSEKNLHINLISEHLKCSKEEVIRCLNLLEEMEFFVHENEGWILKV